MNNEELQLKKDEIHKKIDDCFSLMIKSMGTIFESTKFNETQVVEETNNLEVLTATESIANKMQDLSKIVNDMKVEHLKKNEYDYQLRKKYQKDIPKLSQEITAKVMQLQENYNFINTLLKENKHTKFYKYSLNYENE